MPEQPEPSEDYVEIAAKVRSGEYFREAQAMYDLTVNDPMAERYLYILITTLSGLILLIAIVAARSFYPLETPVPFIYSPNDIIEDLPHMKPLQAYKGEDPSEAVLRFIAQNYVVAREEYDISHIERSVSSVKLQSSNEVFKDFEQAIDARNPDSPVALYQRHSVRKITVLGTKRPPDNESAIDVIYEAAVESKTDVKKTRWIANIAFSYSGVALDENGKPKPVSFLVTQYHAKRLQDTR